MKKTEERNHLGRIKYEYSPELIIWIEDHELDFLEYVKSSPVGYKWNQKSHTVYFGNVDQQNSFIKRMLKYGIFKEQGAEKHSTEYTDNMQLVYVDLDAPVKLHMQSGHNLEQWIRDHWDKYSTETMEVEYVKGAFDIGDHYKIFIASDNQLNSFTIDAETDHSVMEDLSKIENYLNL